MPGEAQQVNALFLHIDGEYPRGLGGIYRKQHTVLLRNGPDAPNVQQISRQIGAVGADNQPGVLPNVLFKIFIPNPPKPVRRENGQFHPCFFQLVQGPENGVVFQRCGDHMVPGAQGALEGSVQALGGVGGEGNAGGVHSAEQFRQSAPGIVCRPGGLQRGIVDAPPGVAEGGQAPNHGIDHGLGLLQRGCRVVKVDHGITSDHQAVHALKGNARIRHQCSQGILPVRLGAPGKAAVRRDLPGDRNEPPVCAPGFALGFHGHGIRRRAEGDYHLFVLLQHSVTAVIL